MSTDLEQLITELEAVTARMLATTCWEQTSEFGQCSTSRRALCAQLLERPDIDAMAGKRIGALIQAGESLVARTLAMRQSVLEAIAETEARQRFTREIGGTVPSEARAHSVDLNA